MTKFLALLLLVAGLGFAADGATYADISTADLAKAIEAKTVTIIDCNGSKSFASNRIPGAINFQAKKDSLKDLLPADKGALIVAYCGSPKCSAYKDGAKAATDLGYTNVKHYSGGIRGWMKDQQKVEKD